MANEVGAVYVSIMPTTSGFSRQIDKELSGGFDSAATKGESRIKGMFGKVAAAGTAILATIGLGKLVKDTVTLGVAYNTLEQTSRAAFKTILGSGEAASQMMSDIKEFAKTSPFPRQAFITATQQMLAFGFAASDAVPYLSAIQDAVAAAGGSADSITEIVDVLSKVKSTGKITAETLNQLGYRGVNAAKLIGAQMGKTEGEIRSSITKGTLDAGDALEALRIGMETTFGGAAANVKETFVGSVDRIKGATRDIASALMAPFVDPNGGGFAVDWANKFADVLREFEGSKAFDSLKGKLRDFGAKLDPIVNKTADLLKVLLDDGWGGFRKELDNIAGTSPRMAGFLSVIDALAPILPAFADAIKTVAPSLEKALPSLANLVVAILPPLVRLLELAAPLIADIADTLANFTIPNFQLGIDGLSDLSWLWDDNKMNEISTDAINGKYGEFQASAATFARDWDAGWVGFWGDFGRGWTQFNADLNRNIAIAIAYLGSLPSRAADALTTAASNMISGVFSAGRSIIGGFIDGIKSMTGELIKATGSVMGIVADFFPHSPAPRGPFSGAGWNAVRDAGMALGAQFGSGLDGAKFGVEASMNGMLSAPLTAGSGASSPAIYVQNPWGDDFMRAKVGEQIQRASDVRTGIARRGVQV